MKVKKVKTSNLKYLAIDWLVTLIEDPDGCKFGVDEWRLQRKNNVKKGEYLYRWSNSWAQSGQILSEARICRTIDHSGLWIAYWTDGYIDGSESKRWMQCDESELIAGLRCLIAKTLGDEVDVPEELV
jgi:hypothetical protein